MPNTTTARPAPMGKPSTQPFGFPLRLFAFRKTIDKARQVKPRVEWLDISNSSVRGSDGTTDFLVKFYLCNGELYAACSCYAAWKAQPCYHIAAAAIDRKLLTHSIDQVAAVEDKPIELEIVDDEPATPPTADRFRPTPTPTHEEREQAFDWRAYRRTPQFHAGWDL